MDDTGDVLWKVADEVEQMPFFNSETFEIFNAAQPILKFFGSDLGHIIEFKMELSGDLLLLTYESWFMLQCQRISQNDPKNDLNFSFINALEEGYFSDLTLVADSGKEFKVHKTILSLSIPLDWNQYHHPLRGLPEDVLQVVLHYLYSACLPTALTEETAKHCIQAVSKLPAFSRLTELCEMFLKSNALKQQIISLVTDMHTCAGRIVDYFSGKPVDCGNSPNHGGTNSLTGGVGGTGDGLASNPAKLCYVIKQSFRECAIAGAKLLILCDLFARRKNELSRVERREIVKYAKSRLPIFMHQLHKFLEVTRQTFSDMPALQRQDIALYLVPQIETTLETMSQFVNETKTSLEQIINTSNPTNKVPNSDRPGKKPVKEVLGKSLRHVLHVRELMKLRNFHDKINQSFKNLVQKRANFTNMTSANKVRSVAKNLEQVIDEIPMFLVRLEELMSALDDKLTWREWKYTFKLGTSKVAWMLQKLVSHQSNLKSMLTQTTEMVHRDQFTQSMVILGLLDLPQDQDSPSSSSTPSTLAKCSPVVLQTSNKANPLESLSIPPVASESNLAKNAVLLLRSEHGADMVFEIVSVEDVSDTVIDHTRGEPVGHTTQEREVEVHLVRAHCVIIASRCDWFRRALLSGMRESIDKKIVVHDTNPALFKVFLEYLYGGTLDTSGLSTVQLADLMLLSDRYEVDSLKQLCEMALKSGINQDSVLFLLSIADQFNAKMLKNAAMEFVSENPEITESEVFCELPEDLQSEVEYKLTWSQSERRDTAARKLQKMEDIRYHSCYNYRNSEEVEDMISSMHLTSRKMELYDSSSLEDVPLTQDSTRLEACVAQLRDIIGESVPHEDLVRISLAADYDVNRALNFFFTN